MTRTLAGILTATTGSRWSRVRSGIVLGVVAVILGATAASAAPVRTGVDDFRFSDYSAVFRLGRDDEGHSTLTTTETFVAEFPADQNRGMQRAIPLDYEGHPTDVRLISVTDEDGTPRPVETESEDGILLVTSAAEDYVSGSRTYVFTYTQRNVTLPASGTGSGQDEFYWDANGTAWRQPFDRYRVRVELEDGLAAAATGTASCYRGAAGSTDGCSSPPTAEWSRRPEPTWRRARTSPWRSASRPGPSRRGTTRISPPAGRGSSSRACCSRSGRSSQPSGGGRRCSATPRGDPR
ncbi:DUF2207 domain-containing protein [Rathayibacter oskolensis]|uniref:DUF2207 domain-containing protein n=1 Tax=Rathayibacter oskolensis TaxID=1891671 RepID=UPI003466C7BD